MNPMFINISNHTSSKWSQEQLEAAKKYGEVVDIAHPQVVPTATTEEVYNNYVLPVVEQLKALVEDKGTQLALCTVHLMGELTFVSLLRDWLLQNNVNVVVSTTARVSQETQNADGSTTKTLVFKFEGFRSLNKIMHSTLYVVELYDPWREGCFSIILPKAFSSEGEALKYMQEVYECKQEGRYLVCKYKDNMYLDVAIHKVER